MDSYYFRRKAKRIAEGKCPVCGEREPVPGMYACDPCLEKKAEYLRSRGEKRKAEGLCSRHGNPILEGHTTCALCVEQTRKYQPKRMANRKAKRLAENARHEYELGLQQIH
jgi:hypothetical protein